ncbi:MAG: hypothetical protein ACOVN0_16115 [Niveispirillum sp.]|uniref:hypothetical protein n=1 Tax=Niveispirillum sp. TaxID=1917217 RepID=UPI003BA711D2
MRKIAAALLVSLMATLPATAQNSAVSGQSPAAPAAKQARVEGFRNARFGMTEAQLREAIGKDFKLSGDDIQKVEDPTERTSALIVKVKDLLPDSGPAVVAYLLGYKSKRLFRVNVIWGQEIGSPVKPEQIVGTANSLRNYLLAQGYQQTGLILNQPLDSDNILVFQGTDTQGRLTELILGILKRPPAKPDAQPEVSGASLRLSYVEKPGEPDIYRVPGGF